MKICHVTPHLPPDQAANALLPFHLGCWARESGGEAVYVAYAARMGSGGRAPELPGPVTWIPSDHNRRGIIKTMKLARVIAAARIMRLATPAVEEADIVHLHSNGLLTEVVSMLAARKNKPVVMTLYGTEIWHYRPKRWGPDLFTRAYRRAAHVTFYSEALQQRAITVGLARRETSIIYPLVAPQFERR